MQDLGGFRREGYSASSEVLTVHRFKTSRFALILCALVIAAFSSATAPDWGATISGAQTDITTQLTTYGPLVVGLIVFIAGFKFVVAWIKSALSQMRSR